MFPILLKFSAPGWLEALREEGLLYMNTLDYFRRLEGDPARGDAREGVSHMIQPHAIGDFVIDSGILTLGSIKVDPKELCGPVRISRHHTAACNVFCMFAITQPIDGNIVRAEHCSDLGSAFVLVLNTREFIRRVAEAARVSGLAGLRGGLVEYYQAAEYSGEVGAFRKSSKYKHQSEYRIVVKPGLDRPRQLRLGSLLDITSEIMPSSEIGERLDFSFERAREAGWAAA